MKPKVKAALDRAIELVSEGGSLDNFAIVSEDGELVDDWAEGTACLAAISGLEYTLNGQRPLFFISNPLQLFKEDYGDDIPKWAKAYVSWVVKKSVWRHAFMPTTLKQVWKSGVVMETVLPCPYLCQASIALRILSEFPDIPHTWFDLEKRLDPHVALYYAHLYQRAVSPEGELLGFFQNNVSGDLHSLFSSNEIKLPHLLLWVNDDISNLETLPSMSIVCDYHPFNAAWLKEDLKGKQEDVPKAFPNDVFTYELFGIETSVRGVSFERLIECIASHELLLETIK